MNISIKRAMLVAGITTTMALPLSTQASDGTITFTGAVTASTCTINVNGSGSTTTTVALPTVDVEALTNVSPRTSAAGTFFNIALSGCTAVNDYGSAAPTHVQIYFEAGPNVDQATSGLINTVTGSNVEVSLYLASASSIVGTLITPGAATNQPLSQLMTNAGTQWFYAGYTTAGANTQATPGAVSTSVTYSLIYN